jgi:hypothetical protein
MAITTYCSCAQVRAILGVSIEEVSDAIIELPLYSLTLSEELYDIGPSFETNYAIVKALPSPTIAQARFLLLADAYASYKVAFSLLGALPMFAPKDQGDNKTTMARVADPFKNLKENIVQATNYMKSRLVNSYSSLYATDTEAYSIVKQINIGAVGTATNPVTGV